MDSKKLLLIGGGGHCRSVLDCVLSTGKYKEIGIVDNDTSIPVLGIPIIGTDDDLSKLFSAGWTDTFVSIGGIGSTVLRRKLYERAKELGFTIPSIIDPSAIIARGIEVKEGVFVGKKVVVNTGSKIDNCAIINTGAVIEHDCIVGAFTHISPGTILCGQVSIGGDTHIGAGSVVRQGIKIGHNSLIGAGSVVVKDLPDNVKAYGNPCRVVE